WQHRNCKKMRLMRSLLTGLALASAATAVFADILPGPRPRRPAVLPDPAPAKLTLSGAAANEIAKIAGDGRALLITECKKEAGASDYTCTFSPWPNGASPDRPGAR